jgi:hypothetical protein
MDGGCTRSMFASSPALIGPHLPTVASAESWDSVTAVFTRWDRSRRAVRNTASRSTEASSVVLCTPVISLA